MPIGILDEHEALRQSARRFIENRCPPSVPRALLDAESETSPDFWEELASMGWLGLHLPEKYGGSGFGLLEQAVVLEELGRAMAPGPYLPTVLASTLIDAGGDEKVRASLLPSMADGRQTAAVAIDAGDLHAVKTDSGYRLHGVLRPVLGASLAQLLVVPARAGTGEIWCVLDAADVSISPLKSLDLTRRVAEVRVDDVTIGPDRGLERLDREQVRDIAGALIAAEAVGGAQWCLDTASEYAKVREQFGRPIGQFQAVKHRCADMLAAVEQARAAAWDATRGADDPSEMSLASSIAAALALDAFFRCAKDCVQTLGGIGFTWEHDAHMYLRRATSLRGLLGGSAPWRARTAAFAMGGVRRTMDVALPEEAEGYRAEVRAFLDSIRDLPDDEQRRRMADEGWITPHYPKPWGRDAGPVQQIVIDEEFKRSGLRRPHLVIGAWVIPTLISYGTPEQQERWIRPILYGQASWCQMFSEPGAGSDLASLQTKATRVEGGWLLTGQKVWTSLAREAHWAICIARTDPTAPKHEGITYFIIDMKTEGIEIRPLRELTGHSMFNEIFLSDVFVPDDCVVGEINDGWRVARTTLSNERVAMAGGATFGRGLEALLKLVASGPWAGDRLAIDTLGGLIADAHSLSLLAYRMMLRQISGADPGPESSVRKLLAVEHEQRVEEVGLTLLGPEGATMEGEAFPWGFAFLANRSLTIAGGTSEVQRNVIAERLLGLPRDP